MIMSICTRDLVRMSCAIPPNYALYATVETFPATISLEAGAARRISTKPASCKSVRNLDCVMFHPSDFRSLLPPSVSLSSESESRLIECIDDAVRKIRSPARLQHSQYLREHARPFGGHYGRYAQMRGRALGGAG